MHWQSKILIKSQAMTKIRVRLISKSINLADLTPNIEVLEKIRTDKRKKKR